MLKKYSALIAREAKVDLKDALKWYGQITKALPARLKGDFREQLSASSINPMRTLFAMKICELPFLQPFHLACITGLMKRGRRL